LRKLKAISLIACVLMLATVAGVIAKKAFAGTDTYCSSCTISNVPAVSDYLPFTSNHSSTVVAKKQQIYYFDPNTQAQSGSESSGSTRVLGLNHTGSPSTFQATARCHLLNDGSVTATCWADFPS